MRDAAGDMAFSSRWQIVGSCGNDLHRIMFAMPGPLCLPLPLLTNERDQKKHDCETQYESPPPSQQQQQHIDIWAAAEVEALLSWLRDRDGQPLLQSVLTDMHKPLTTHLSKQCSTEAAFQKRQSMALAS